MAQKSFLQRTRPTIWADETTAMEKNAAVFFFFFSPALQATFEPSEILKLKCDRKALHLLSILVTETETATALVIKGDGILSEI